MKPKPVPEPEKPTWDELQWWHNPAFGSSLGGAVAWLRALGLSPLTNSDKNSLMQSDRESREPDKLIRYGLRGITSYGARRVRCCAHLLQERYGNHRLVFATATVPALPVEDMARLHEHWSEVLETYRRKLRRHLRNNDLSGELVSVVEVQEKRYQRTGLPVLHVHSVFVGKSASGQWAVTPEAHDQMWGESLSQVLGHSVGHLSAACNLQRVKKSAEGYLGKYLSKGTKVVALIKADGLERWLPKQWWAASRSLCAWVDQETRDVSDIAEWLNDVANEKGTEIWMWHRDVVLEMSDGFLLKVARYGKLSIRQTAQIRDGTFRKKLSDYAELATGMRVV